MKLLRSFQTFQMIGVAHYWAALLIFSFTILFLFSYSFAQNTQRLFVEGATPVSGPTTTTTNYSYTNTGLPDYCQTPANQSRPECQGSSPTTNPSQLQNSSAPGYCVGFQYTTRPECQVAQNNYSAIPLYCLEPTNQNLPQCQNTLNRPPSPPLQLICSEPSNVGTPLCQEYFATQPTPRPIPDQPTYCQTPANQSRPECNFPITPPIVITPPQFCPPGINSPNCIPQPYLCAGINDPLCLPPYIQPPFFPTPPPSPIICNPNYPSTNCIPPPRPCIDGIYDPLCNVVQPPNCSPEAFLVPSLGCVVLPPPTPVINPNLPTDFPAFRELPPPPPCPPNLTSVPNIDCLNRQDFALPIPPPDMDCQLTRNLPSDPLSSIRNCARIFFTHDNAYTYPDLTPKISATQGFSFVFRSPFIGTPFFFAHTADGNLHILHQFESPPDAPHIPPPPPPMLKMYDQIHLPRQKSGFKIEGAVTEVIAVVLVAGYGWQNIDLSPSLVQGRLSNISSKLELDQFLIDIGINEKIYHGYLSVPIVPLPF